MELSVDKLNEMMNDVVSKIDNDDLFDNTYESPTLSYITSSYEEGAEFTVKDLETLTGEKLANRLIEQNEPLYEVLLDMNTYEDDQRAIETLDRFNRHNVSVDDGIKIYTDGLVKIYNAINNLLKSIIYGFVIDCDDIVSKAVNKDFLRDYIEELGFNYLRDYHNNIIIRFGAPNKNNLSVVDISSASSILNKIRSAKYFSDELVNNSGGGIDKEDIEYLLDNDICYVNGLFDVFDESGNNIGNMLNWVAPLSALDCDLA